MATRNIVPRADNEGGIGTTLKKWATGFIKVLTVDTINALTPTALATGFSIAGGTTPKTLTVDETAALSSKLTIPGAWITPAFSASDFSGGGSQTWTVGGSNVSAYAYTILGKCMTIIFSLRETTVGGTPGPDLYIRIPASKSAAKEIRTPIYVFDNEVAGIGFAYLYPNDTNIGVEKVAGVNWTASTNKTYIFGQMTFEIN